MKRYLKVFVTAIMIAVMAAGVSSTASFAGPETASGQEYPDAWVETISGLDVWLPDDTWHGQTYVGGVGLYKDGFYDSNNPTVVIYTDDLSAEDDMLFSKNFHNGDEAIDFTVTMDDYVAIGYRSIHTAGAFRDVDKTLDFVFCPVGDQECLRFNILVEVNGRSYMSVTDDVILAIVEKTLRLNFPDALTEFGAGSDTADSAKTDGAPSDVGSDEGSDVAGMDGSGAATDIDRMSDGEVDETAPSGNPDYVLETPETYGPGETFAAQGYTFQIPEGWEAFSSKWSDEITVMKDGDKSEYGEKPSVLICYYEDQDTHDAAVHDKYYCDEWNDITVRINGTDCEAFLGRKEMASKPVYWEYYNIYYPLGENQCIQFEVTADSSEYEGLTLDDPDVLQIITSVSLLANSAR